MNPMEDQKLAALEIDSISMVPAMENSALVRFFTTHWKVIARKAFFFFLGIGIYFVFFH